MGTFQQLLLNGMVAGCSYGLMALSFSLIYRLVHFFHFSHGAIFTVGAYVALWISLDRRPVLAVLVAVACCGLLGGILEALLYRPLRRRQASSVVLLVVSIGVLVATQNTLAMLFGDEVRLLLPASGREGLKIGSAYITPVQITVLIVSTTLCAVAWLALRFTAVGQVLRAIECDEELAEIVGIDISLVTLYTFTAGSVLSGLAGLLAASDNGLRPTMGFQALLLGITGMIIGGGGGVLNSLAGGVAIGLVQQFCSLFIDSKWQDALVFLLLSTFLLLRPHGLRKSFVGRAD